MSNGRLNYREWKLIRKCLLNHRAHSLTPRHNEEPPVFKSYGIMVHNDCSLMYIMRLRDTSPIISSRASEVVTVTVSGDKLRPKDYYRHRSGRIIISSSSEVCLLTQATINFINTANAMEDFIEMHFYLRHRVFLCCHLFALCLPAASAHAMPTKSVSSGDIFILGLRVSAGKSANTQVYGLPFLPSHFLFFVFSMIIRYLASDASDSSDQGYNNKINAP